MERARVCVCICVVCRFHLNQHRKLNTKHCSALFTSNDQKHRIKNKQTNTRRWKNRSTEEKKLTKPNDINVGIVVVRRSRRSDIRLWALCYWNSMSLMDWLCISVFQCFAEERFAAHSFLFKLNGIQYSYFCLYSMHGLAGSVFNQKKRLFSSSSSLTQNSKNNKSIISFVCTET